MQRVLGITIFSLGVMAPAVAPAQAPPRPAPKAEAQQNYVRRFDFDNDQVTGTLLHPEGVMVSGRGKAKQPSLVQPRQSFLPELVKSATGL